MMSLRNHYNVVFLFPVILAACKSDAPAADQSPAATPAKVIETSAPSGGAGGMAPAREAPEKVNDVVPEGEDLQAEAADEEPESPNVKLQLDVHPKSAQAMAWWGKQRLGVAPLTVERPRKTGPMDIVIKADGYLDYHTRFFTDRSERLIVRMIRPADSHTLLGYVRPPETPDAGVPILGAPPGAWAKTRDAGVKKDALPKLPIGSRKPDAGARFVIPKGVSF